jgi:hypothetical protein
MDNLLWIKETIYRKEVIHNKKLEQFVIKSGLGDKEMGLR